MLLGLKENICALVESYILIPILLIECVSATCLSSSSLESKDASHQIHCSDIYVIIRVAEIKS
jgi:hypothetical protein